MPASWYPVARSLERRIIFHTGPPNSGKTHAALADLAAAPSGVYCGPLRLLAWEIAERLNNPSANVPCHLITGQERRLVEGARHVACTVEMASTRRKVDVAVIDEIQLLADPTRGWAFTRALLGSPANVVHVCGDPSALPLIERICEQAKEPLEVRHYERLSPLRPSRMPLVSLQKVRSGDAVVAFSRREVHSVRREIESMAGRRCAVVYGSLPPDARSQQALLFNAPRTGVNVLATSDAVGMGLNLQIGRVVFTALSKYDGLQERQLTPAEIKQIAGRAGRYNSKYSAEGVATTLHPEDLPVLHEALETPSDCLTAAALFPRFDQLAAVAGAFPDESLLPQILDRFARDAALADGFFLCDLTDVRANAVMLRHLGLSLYEQYLFAIAPCDPGDTLVAQALLDFASVFASRRPVTPSLIHHPPLTVAESLEQLKLLEAVHRVYDLFVWLSYRFEESFEGRDKAMQARGVCSALIDESIAMLGVLPASRRKIRKPTSC
jgi:ATP-dependent RNA helicase SUPV3L1/SUV3